MDLAPRLIPTHVPEQPTGAVLVLHGGASRRADVRVSPTQLSVLRMIPVANGIAGAGRGELEVYRLLNSRRGWDTAHTPIHDVDWALTQLDNRLPVCLVGHSLGGRAALMAAGRPQVAGAAALAPWVYASDVPQGLRGRPLLIVHGDRDKIASPERSEAMAANLRRLGQPVEYMTVPGGKHAMLSHHRAFTEPAAAFAVQTLRAAAVAA